MKSQKKKKTPGKLREMKSLADYVYKAESSKQTSQFAVITKYLINHIRREYLNGDDIATALDAKKDSTWHPSCR